MENRWPMFSHTTSVAYFFITFWIFILWSFHFMIIVSCGSFEIWFIKTTTTKIIIMLPLPWSLAWPQTQPHPRLKFTTLSSGNSFVSVGRDLWFFIHNSLFCSTTRRHEMSILSVYYQVAIYNYPICCLCVSIWHTIGAHHLSPSTCHFSFK